jgi:hypothetical protein
MFKVFSFILGIILLADFYGHSQTELFVSYGISKYGKAEYDFFDLNEVEKVWEYKNNRFADAYEIGFISKIKKLDSPSLSFKYGISFGKRGTLISKNIAVLENKYVIEDVFIRGKTWNLMLGAPIIIEHKKTGIYGGLKFALGVYKRSKLTKRSIGILATKEEALPHFNSSSSAFWYTSHLGKDPVRLYETRSERSFNTPVYSFASDNERNHQLGFLFGWKYLLKEKWVLSADIHPIGSGLNPFKIMGVQIMLRAGILLNKKEAVSE